MPGSAESIEHSSDLDMTVYLLLDVKCILNNHKNITAAATTFTIIIIRACVTNIRGNGLLNGEK